MKVFPNCPQWHDSIAGFELRHYRFSHILFTFSTYNSFIFFNSGALICLLFLHALKYLEKRQRTASTFSPSQTQTPAPRSRYTPVWISAGAVCSSAAEHTLGTRVPIEEGFFLNQNETKPGWMWTMSACKLFCSNYVLMNSFSLRIIESFLTHELWRSLAYILRQHCRCVPFPASPLKREAPPAE